MPGGVGQDIIDLRAFDHRVGVAAHAGVEEQVADVAQAARGLVEEVFGHAGAEHAARDGDLGELRRQHAAVVLERQVHLGHPERLAGGAAVEDHVLHRVATQLLGRLLAQHPADGVGDVGLAAAVRADDARNAVAELQFGAVGERLEALDLEFVEKHPCTPRARGSGSGRARDDQATGPERRLRAVGPSKLDHSRAPVTGKSARGSVSEARLRLSVLAA